MIEIKCDKCGAEMDPQGLLGQISWRFKEGMDGNYGENELANHIFCERCMDLIMTMIQSKITWENEPQARPKRKKSELEDDKAEKIIILYKQGKKVREIAEAVGLDSKKVENWIYYKKHHGGI